MQPQLPRPVGVILLALNYLVIGSFGTLFLPIILLFAAGALSRLFSNSVHSKPLGLFLTCLVVIVWLGAYVLYALIGYGMLKLRAWSLKAAIATHWIGLALALIATAVVAKFDWMLSLSIGAFSFLWVGGILYYLRRPRVQWPFKAATAIANRELIPPQPPASTTPTWKIVTCLVTVFVLGVSVFVVGLFASIEKSFRSSTAYTMALNRAQTSSCVARTLGQPIVAKGLISGNLNTNNDSGEANLDIPIRGPKSAGNLHVEAKKADGTWTINSLTVEHSAGQIHIAPVASACD